jgi:hypothetical protein
MLNTTLLSAKKLAVGYSFFISFGICQFASSASLYQDFNWSSQSLCFAQNSHNIFLAITLTVQIYK